MHGVLWRDISLCTDTHNNESAKLGHHNGCNSFPGESTTIAWQSRIYLNHCISRQAHYSFVMAALCCTVTVPLHYVFALTCAVLCVRTFASVCASELVCSPVSHIWPDSIFTMHVSIQYISEFLIEFIDFPLVTDTSSHTRTANNTQRRSYYPSRECFSMCQLVCLHNWLLSLLSSCHCSSSVGWPG